MFVGQWSSIQRKGLPSWDCLSIYADLASWATVSSEKNMPISLGVIILAVSRSHVRGRRLRLSLLSIKTLTSSLFLVAHLMSTFLWSTCPSSGTVLNQFNLFPAGIWLSSIEVGMMDVELLLIQPFIQLSLLQSCASLPLLQYLMPLIPKPFWDSQGENLLVAYLYSPLQVLRFNHPPLC